jgi:hypothetical protein
MKMGIDITLRSQFTEEVYEPILERWRSTEPIRDGADGKRYCSEHAAWANAIYGLYEETGAYFREPYNCFALLPMLDVNIRPLISEDETLPIEAARHLLAVVESRPLTLEHVKHAVCGSRQRAVINSFEEFMNPAPIEHDEINWPATYAWLTKKHERLIALLRRSIELDEPLLCD